VVGERGGRSVAEGRGIGIGKQGDHASLELLHLGTDRGRQRHQRAAHATDDWAERPGAAFGQGGLDERPSDSMDASAVPAACLEQRLHCRSDLGEKRRRERDGQITPSGRPGVTLALRAGPRHSFWCHGLVA